MTDVELLLCDDRAYAGLQRLLGGITHHCPVCGGTDHGRPSLPGRRISVSHCRELHLVALSDRPVGVDLERYGDGGGIDDVALHPSERAALDLLPAADRARELLRVWVAKEAVLKLRGTGLSVAPERFVVRHDDGWYDDGWYAAGGAPDARADVHWLDLPGHAAALATTGPVGRLSPRDLRTGEN